MTTEELTAVRTKINELETDAVNTRQAVQEAIEQARKLNAVSREGNTKLRVISEAVAKLKAAEAEHVAAENAERRRIATEKAKAEAEANAAAKAKEQSEL